MKMLVKELAKLTGVSIRTLHYYDEINLLKPAFVDEQNGYRYYDENSLERMQEIMFYRELDFSLKTISEILLSPKYDKKKALSEQKKLLILKRKRIEQLINALDKAEKGEKTMSFKEFDNTEYETARNQYAKEATEKYGNTKQYKDFEKKSSSYTADKWDEVNNGMFALIKSFSDCKDSGNSCDSKNAQQLVEDWQKFISDNYYECNKECLSGLGQMYICDERFKKNMDKYSQGTAQYISDAIKFFCKK